jgi:hypothetical protein
LRRSNVATGVLGRRREARAAQPGVDVARRLLAVADRDGHVALGRHHVAAGEEAGATGHHRRRIDADDAVVDLEAGTPSSSERSTSWPSASTTESAANVSKIPVAQGLPFSSSSIFSIVRRCRRPA